MKNGKWQELEVIEDLTLAGFKLSHVGTNQLKVHMTKVPITGRPDGIITERGKEHLLEIKAFNYNSYAKIKAEGLEAFPGYKAQVNLYLMSRELKDRVAGCHFYVKHKDSCIPFSLYEPRDEAFINPIIEAIEEVVVGGAEISRPETPIKYCSMCRKANFCWGTEVLNTEKVLNRSLEDLSNMWLEGKRLSSLGEMQMEDSKAGLIGHISEDEDLLITDSLKVARIRSKRTNISTSKFIEKYGAPSLMEVMEEKESSYFRITEV